MSDSRVGFIGLYSRFKDIFMILFGFECQLLNSIVWSRKRKVEEFLDADTKLCASGVSG